jgi:biotin carboxylase
MFPALSVSYRIVSFLFICEQTINALKELPFPVRAIIPGAETGVELADQLSHRMGLRSNGVAKSLARRNKYHMGEAVRSAGVRAVVQAMCQTEEEVRKFVRGLPGNNSRCVVKPVQSAGSDDVFLCADEDEAVTALGRIIGTMNGVGLHNDCVLVQEYLKGKEYVIDKVSLDGKHKLVGIWEYEKRSVNDSHFVYFGMRLMDPNPEKMQIMVRYADQVLDALDIRHGPSHMEVMLDNWGTAEEPQYVPCLVEVGARCQGGEGTWLPLAKEALGFTPVGT